ncbi:MAG: mechanosensitive ion channel family protein [Acidobacteriota bacterium]
MINKALTFINVNGLVNWPLIVVKLVAIVVAAYVIHKIIDQAIVKAMAARRGGAESLNPRLATLTSLTQSIIMYIVYFVAGILLLQVLGVKTQSLLASAGILGLVVGLGFQNLIRDLVSGFFVIFENQYSVGDYVQIGALSGFVSDIGLRSTRLTDLGGEVHTIPNGQINTVTNHTRSNRKATVDIKIPNTEDVDRVISVLTEVAAKTAQDFDYIKDGPSVQGVVDLSDAFMVIRLTAMTIPQKQGDIERELRIRIKRCFDREGIGVYAKPATPL